MATLPSHLQALLPEPSELRLERVERTSNLILIVVKAAPQSAACPDCRVLSHRIHSRYERTLRDLPRHGATVRLRLAARRFYCRSPDCGRKIFTERLAEDSAEGDQIIRKESDHDSESKASDVGAKRRWFFDVGESDRNHNRLRERTNDHPEVGVGKGHQVLCRVVLLIKLASGFGQLQLMCRSFDESFLQSGPLVTSFSSWH